MNSKFVLILFVIASVFSLMPVDAFDYATNVYCINRTSNSTVECNRAGGWVSETKDDNQHFAMDWNFTMTFVTVYNTTDTIFDVYQNYANYTSTWSCDSYFTYDTRNYYQCHPNITSGVCLVNFTLIENSFAGGSPALQYTIPTFALEHDRWLSHQASPRLGMLRDSQTVYYNNDAPYMYIRIADTPCEDVAGYTNVFDFYNIRSGWREQEFISIGLIPQPSVTISNPIEGDVENLNFTFTTSIANMDLCPSAQVQQYFVNSDDEIIESWSNSSPIDGDWINEVVNNQFGTNFEVQSYLYCDGSLNDTDVNTFSITLNNVTANRLNDTDITKKYDQLCFYTPLPGQNCGTDYQNVALYTDDVLYWELNNTDAIEFCFRNLAWDGDVSFEFMTWCHDDGSFIDDYALSIGFYHHPKYFAQNVSSFFKSITPGTTAFIFAFVAFAAILIVVAVTVIFKGGKS